MLQLFLNILGIISLLAPFIVVFCFKNKIKGFAYVSTAVFILHIFVALLTQVLHIFSYSLILVIHLIVAGVSIGIFMRHHASLYLDTSEKKSRYYKYTRWVPYLAALIIFFQLFSVHYNYTGLITTFSGFQKVEHAEYPYPYFSDEWIGAGLAQYSISSHSLPTVNPLFFNQQYPNFLVVYFSFIAEIILLLGLFPLTAYPMLAIGSGMFIIFLIYVYLREENISTFSAIVTALLVPFIVNGANLPGIWYLLPFHVSFMLFMLALILMAQKDKYAAIPALFALLVYPPMIVFVLPSLLIYLLPLFRRDHIREHKHIKIRTYIKENIRELSLYGAIVTVLALFIITLIIINTNYSFSGLVHIISGLFVRTNLTQNGIPAMPIWNVMPLIGIFLAIYGLIGFGRHRLWLSVPIAMGGLLWWIYSNTSLVFIIDYPRVVMITSWLLMLCVGYGIEHLIYDIRTRPWKSPILQHLHKLFHKQSVFVTFQFLLLVVFFAASCGYTARTNWTKLQLQIPSVHGTMNLLPAAPANRYLTSDDIRLFEGLSKNIFISPSWKGLVLGVATGNYPLESKPATIANQYLSYNEFIGRDCASKIALATQKRIGYVYGARFDCPGFEAQGTSTEGLILYRFRP